MKTFTIPILVVALVGCGNSEDTISSAKSKENFDKGISVIGKRQQELREANKQLRNNANPQKASSASSEK